jgi:hypothetical protein
MKIKSTLLAITAFSALGAASSQAALTLVGVIDGDLSGGVPKAIVLLSSTATADLSTYSVSNFNNGGLTETTSLTLSGVATAGQFIVIAQNATSAAFFTTNYPTSDFIAFTSGVSNINGDDAIRLFLSTVEEDNYGVVGTDGTGETWEYADGYSVRTGGTPGAFDVADWSFNNGALDTLDEGQQASALGAAFNNFDTIPEPSAALLGAIGFLALLRRRR